MTTAAYPIDALATERVACAHCGLEVPSGLTDAHAPRQFCCAGCRTAFAILHEHGLDGYYGLAQRRDVPVRASGRSFDEFDHAAFRELYVRRTPDGLAQVDLYLEGVHCASCVWLVERVPMIVPGVARAELNVRRALARVVWDDAATPLSDVARALDALGYRPHPFRGLKAEAMRRAEDRAMLVRIGVAGAIAINVMLAALALYSGWFGGMEQSWERFFRWLSLALTVPAILGPGRVFFRGAWAALRTRTLHMDVPIALAIAVGLLRGAQNTVRDAGPIYFDGLATLTFALLTGRYLQARGQRMAADSAELLHSLAPSTARVVEGTDADERVHDVPAEALLPGMLLDVRAGDTLPADGVVERGRSTLDLSLLTGESRPVSVDAGAAVYAGTLNLGAPLRVRVTESGETSRLAGILKRVEESASAHGHVTTSSAIALSTAWSGLDGHHQASVAAASTSTVPVNQPASRFANCTTGARRAALSSTCFRIPARRLVSPLSVTRTRSGAPRLSVPAYTCLLYTSDAADEL